MNECCADCRGPNSPTRMCQRHLDCDCHRWKDALAKNTPIPNSHRDPTYYTAMRNLKKGSRN